MKLIGYGKSGATHYAVLLNSNGQAWNGSAFETIEVGSWANYALAMTEGAAGIFTGTVPSLNAGQYSYVLYERAGATPATTDKQASFGSFTWNGTTEVYQTGDAYGYLFDLIEGGQLKVGGESNSDEPAWYLGQSGAELRICGNDCTVDMGQQQRCKEIVLASGALRRDVVAVKRRWTLHWAYLPASQQYTYDGGMGRDELYTLYRGGASLNWRIQATGGGSENVTVLFEADSWREKLLVQDGPLGNVYELSFTLVEV